MPGSATHHLTCPSCQAELRPDRTKMNVVIDVCPDAHGIFLDPDDVEQIVGSDGYLQLKDLIDHAPRSSAECPSCGRHLRNTSGDVVGARGCANCGSMWFDNDQLKAHVLEVRTRAYGENSMAARADVMRDAAAFYPGEVAAGILTEYTMEHPR